MTAIDTKARRIVYEKIQKFGTTGAFTVGTSTYDAATGIGTPSGDPSPSPQNVKVSPPARFKKSLIDGEHIQAGDAQSILPALNTPFTPQSGDKVTINSESFSIVHVDPIHSGEQVAAFKLHLRQ